MKDFKHGGRTPRCKVKEVGYNGKTYTCGMPLNAKGECPTHGRPW